jgi:hypothetical protein
MASQSWKHPGLATARQMKRYLVFTYYAGRSLGGMKDYLDAFESQEEALENILKEANRYYQIVDLNSLEIIKEGLAIYKDFSPEHFSSEDPRRDETV